MDKEHSSPKRKIHAFWDSSRFQVQNTLKREFKESDQQLRADYETKTARFADLEDHEEKVQEKESQVGLYLKAVNLCVGLSSRHLIFSFVI